MGLACIVCPHVAAGEPIFRAVRDEPLDAQDSGWQFICEAGDHEDETAAKVWSLETLLRREPSLQGLMSAPPGTTLERRGRTGEWIRA